MIQNMFSVHDEKAQAFLPPFFLPSIGQAKRVFGDCINSAEHQFGKHPSDYTLFNLGEFDDNSAKFGITAPQSLGNGVEFLTPIQSAAEEYLNEIRDDTQVRPDAEGGNST